MRNIFFKIIHISVYFSCFVAVFANAQVTSAWQVRQWNACWVTIPSEPLGNYGVYHFRRSFELDAAPESFIVHVSGDQRYILYVNGHQVSRGPARGDLQHWMYESVDVANYLQKGENVIGATVWNYGEWTQGAQVSLCTGFIIQGNGQQEEVVNSNASWKVVKNMAYTPSLDYIQDVGPGDIIHGDAYPWGWNTVGYNDENWKSVVVKEPGQPCNTGTQYLRALTPRTIPAMEEKIESPLVVRKCTNAAWKNAFMEGKPIIIGSNTHTTFLLDQGYLTNAYPTWYIGGGKGASMKVTYAESLFKNEEDKGNRNDIEGKFIKGFVDKFYPEGGSRREYTPLWFRTYRYIEVDIQTAGEPLIIHSFEGRFTGYPFKENASFTCDREVVNQIWKIGWHTARLCAGETYYDCPYYEQLQYGGDTRIQALISLYVSGDDRLVRKAITDLASSRTSSGLLWSRYPSRYSQIIPPFSLYWINMLHDYCLLRPDTSLLTSHLSIMKGIIEWYLSKINPATGMLGEMPHWNFVDWTAEWPWSDTEPIGGVPPGGRTGGSSILSLQFAYALSDAVDLLRLCGENELAANYENVKKQLCHSTMKRCYDSQRGVVADDGDCTSYSQHAIIMAILSGALGNELSKLSINKMLSDKTLIQATVYYRFYLFKAMKKCGMGDLYVDNLDIWERMIDSGLSTFAEKPEPSRSDCHAWSASPTYDLLATVCGIEPASFGFETVRISPHLGSLKYVIGKVPHPNGMISVNLKRIEQSITGIIILPEGVVGTYCYNGIEIPLAPGMNKI